MKIGNRKSPRGFTLIELLVVIAIISLLVSILLPSLNRAKALARQVVCRSQIRSLGQVGFVYSSDQNGFLPGATDGYSIGLSSKTGDGGGNPEGWAEVCPDYMSNGQLFFCPSVSRSSTTVTGHLYQCHDDPWSWPNTWRGGYFTHAWTGGGSYLWKGRYTWQKLGGWSTMDDGTWTYFHIQMDSHPEPSGLAILSDPWGFGYYWDIHETGFNACYADGHASWVGDEDDDIASLANSGAERIFAWEIFDDGG